jgi:hypothetical protein
MPLARNQVNCNSMIMVIHPAVIVHGLADARMALAVGAPATLLSAPGAGIYGGCLWWRSLAAAARAAFPTADMMDLLDCADASGMAMAALRVGVNRLVLWPEAPGWAAVARIAEGQGGFVLPTAPAALDMASRGAERRLHGWLRKPGLRCP